MGMVFAKTRKGQEEIETKAGGLTPRVRRVLILIDGRRTVEDLGTMVQSDDLQHTLESLRDAGFIEPAAGSEVPETSAAPATVTAFQELPPEIDPLRLQKARNFMTNTLNVFVGSLGASSLLDRIDQSNSHADLRALFDEWYQAIVMSREGKREAETLRAKLLEVI